ncbi:MAG: hypothetical protein PWP15_1110 [Methanothermococcus sp.]|uniref:hypothetical protein n=1 Tax=Methanothermococcus sp. TaxID=2614238 RepID=UPI00258E5D29|nr:hypothetical protein [Methanothermococcus sp.]MDK2790603.1 hypothetical protein [Methanothermococcus sp.]
MDFNTISPWKDMKRVVVDKYTGNKIKDFNYGDSEFAGWTATEWENSSYDIMVEIPKFYYKTVDDGTGLKWSITAQPRAGYIPHPAFTRKTGLINYAYRSAFEGYIDANGMLRSIPYVQPTTGRTIAQFRTAAKAGGRSSFFQLQNAYIHHAIVLLFMIEMGDLNSQAILSQGITNLDSGSGNHSQNTGHTLELGNGTGEVILAALENGATGATETYPFCYRGIENLWGNVLEFLDGMFKNADGLYFGEENDLANPANMKEFYPREDVTEYRSGYVDKADKRIPWGIIPSVSFGGSSSTYLTDHMWYNVGERVALSGAFWRDGSQAGLLALVLDASPSFSSRAVGARLAGFREV